MPHGVTDNEFLKCHRSILEAKICFWGNLVCSIASETIENSENYINQSDEVVKQDCESKAFVRLAANIKRDFRYCRSSLQQMVYMLQRKCYRYVKITIGITKSNAKKIVHAGRNRWKIENQGFNRQKHWQGRIEHACSFHDVHRKITIWWNR